MNRRIIKYFTTVLIIVTAITNCYGIDSIRYVVSIDGINLRDTNSIDGKIIERLPFESFVIITDDSYRYESINDRPGKWVKVKTLSETGFVYSSFLSPFRFSDVVDFKNVDYENNTNYIMQFLDYYVSDEIGSSLQRVSGLDINGGDLYNCNTYVDGSTFYYYYGYEVEIGVLESAHIDANNLLNFFNYLNYAENKGKIHYKDNVDYTLADFPQSFRYIYKGSFSYIYSNSFVVSHNKVKVVLDFGLGRWYPIWPEITINNEVDQRSKLEKTDLNNNGITEKIKIKKSNSYPKYLISIAENSSRKLSIVPEVIYRNVTGDKFLSEATLRVVSDFTFSGVETENNRFVDNKTIDQGVILKCDSNGKSLVIYYEEGEYCTSIVN